MQASKIPHYAIALFLLLLLVCFYLWMGTINAYPGNISDSHYYLLLADFFGPSANEVPGVESYIVKTTVFPPGYPFVLSIFGGSADSIVRAHQITSAFYVAGFLAIFYWLHAGGLKLFSAIILTLILALNHQQLVLSVNILSESQYFLISAVIIILLEKADTRERLLIVSGLIGFAILTRSIGIAFLLPLLVQSFRSPINWFGRGLILSLALLPALAWKIIQNLYLDFWLRSNYLDDLTTAYSNAPFQALVNKISSNFAAVIQAWLDYLGGLPSAFHLGFAIILGACVLINWIIRLRRLDTLALYLFSYFGIVMLWPYPLEMNRFMLPVFPFLLAMLVFDAGGLQHNKRKIARSLLLGLIVVSFVPATISVLQRMATSPEEEYAKYRMTDEWLTIDSIESANETLKLIHLRAVAEASISEYMDASDCVYSLAPSSITLTTRNLSLLLLQNGIPISEFKPANLTLCDFVFMIGGSTLQSGAEQLFPYEIMRNQMKLLYVLETELGGEPFIAAMLGEIIREDEGTRD